MGYTFTLVLGRELTDSESVALKEASCAELSFGDDRLPTDAEVPVTKVEFDDLSSTTLAEAIEAGLEAARTIPELSVPGLSVPAQPAGPVSADSVVPADAAAADSAA